MPSIYTRDGYIIPTHGAVNPRNRLRPDQSQDFMFGQEPPESTKEFEHVKDSIRFLRGYIPLLQKYQQHDAELQRLRNELTDVNMQANELKGKLAEMGYMTQLEVSDDEEVETADVDELDGEDDHQSKRRKDRARHETDSRQYGQHIEDDRRVRQRTGDTRRIEDEDRQYRQRKGDSRHVDDERQPHKRHRS